MLKKVLSAVVLLIWMAVIFVFSSQNGNVSGELSGGVTRWIAEKTVSGFSEMSPEDQKIIVESMHIYVRKAAHFSEYAVLGIIAVLNAGLYSSSKKRNLAISAGFCLLYAASDEFHQLFTADRWGSPVDVMIDFSGSLSGILLVTAAAFLLRRSNISCENKKTT